MAVNVIGTLGDTIGNAINSPLSTGLGILGRQLNSKGQGASSSVSGTGNTNVFSANAQKITLTSVGGASSAGGSTGTIGAIGKSTKQKADIEFYASPEIEESGSTIYMSLDDVRTPASIMVWMGSPSRTFTINAKLISRTQDEARESFRQKSLLQAWRTPQNNAANGGAETTVIPEVIVLDGYGGQFNKIPTVVKSVNFTYPIDVDYISDGTRMVPIVWPVNITLVEYHTQTDMSEFDYQSFKLGTLNYWS